MKDNRPDPRPRKHPHLWQAYLAWAEMVEMRKRHTLRIDAIKNEKSNLSLDFERAFFDSIQLDYHVESFRNQMIDYGVQVGEIWDWLIAIHGIGESLAAQLIANLDDISRYDTISKLWRFAGLAVINGKAEKPKKGEKSPFSRRLRSLMWVVGGQFIRMQTPLYVDIYYEEKEYQRRVHPEKYKNEKDKWMYNDGHIANMAQRKMVKIFLSHVWVVWRTYEGLPVTYPYAQQILGHEHYIAPVDFRETSHGTNST